MKLHRSGFFCSLILVLSCSRLLAQPEKLDSTIRFYQDSITSHWVFSNKSEYAYDAAGNNTLYVYYNRDDTTNSWAGIRKVEYAYDANDNNVLRPTINGTQTAMHGSVRKGPKIHLTVRETS